MKLKLLVLMISCLFLSTPVLAQAKADASKPAVAAKADAGRGSASVMVEVPKAEKAPVPEAENAQEAGGQLVKALEAAKKGKWWQFSALVVMLLMFLFKKSGQLVKLGRWKYVAAPALSLLAALFASFQAGASLEAAIGVFTSSWATSSLQQLWKKGLLGGSKEEVEEAPAEEEAKEEV